MEEQAEVVQALEQRFPAACGSMKVNTHIKLYTVLLISPYCCGTAQQLNPLNDEEEALHCSPLWSTLEQIPLWQPWSTHTKQVDG